MRGFRLHLVAWAASLAAMLVTVTPVGAQFNRISDLAGGSAADSRRPVVSVEAQFTAPAGDRRGRLSVTAKIKPDWHIYSITQPAGGPVATSIKLKASESYRLVGEFQAVPPPVKKAEPAFDNLMVESHYGRVDWHAAVELASGVDPATLRIEGTLRAQPCDPNSCLPPQNFPFTAAAPVFDPDSLVIDDQQQLEESSMLLAIMMGFVGGVILNLMPCVLPVIGLKLLSFLEQAGHSRRQALMLNVWYSLGLLSVFLVLATLAVFLGLGWGQLFSYKGFNVTLAAVVFVMGLSFLGVWEIPIPGFVGGRGASELSQKEGVAGAFAKGVLTTILATPCSAPFLAPALAWAVAQPASTTYVVFTSVGLGMASPYLLIGAFPELLRFLPKPGAWMDTFKQTMGFVLLGTVVFVLTFLPWPAVVPTVGLLFGLWGSCWWIGRTAPGAEFGNKVRRWIEAAAFAAVVWMVTFGWLSGVMSGRFDLTIEEGIANRLSGLNQPGQQAGMEDPSRNRGTAGDNNELPWQPFTRKILEESIAAEKTVLVDFTADWCLTCKTLEKMVLNTSEVRAVVDANGIVALHADWTHGAEEVTDMLDALGSKQVPVLAIFPAGAPNRPTVLRGGYTKQTLLDALKKARGISN